MKKPLLVMNRKRNPGCLRKTNKSEGRIESNSGLGVSGKNGGGENMIKYII